MDVTLGRESLANEISCDKDNEKEKPDKRESGSHTEGSVQKMEVLSCF